MLMAALSRHLMVGLLRGRRGIAVSLAASADWFEADGSAGQTLPWNLA